MALGGVLALGAWFLVFRRPPVPPVVPLTQIDPTLASLITTSRLAVIAAPKSSAAWGRLAQGLQAAEFQAEAMFCYSNAARLDSKEVRWPYMWGHLELQHAPESAIEKLARAVELDGGRTGAPRYALARALIERGHFDQARPHLELLVAVNRHHAAAHLEMARIHAARGELKEATRELQSPLTNQLTERQALLLGAQIAQRNNQAQVAEQLSRRAAAMPRAFDWPDPYWREIQNLRADRAKLADAVNALLQQRRLDDAEVALGRLLTSFPKDGEALLLLGRLRYLQKNCHEAEVAYRRFLEQEPNSLNGHIQLGLALLCQERWTNAAGTFERAAALKPDFAPAHHNLAIARAKGGDSAGAIRAYREALRCAPGDVNILFALAEELANVGQLKEAAEFVNRAAVIAPKDPRVAKARQELGIRE
jgi:tetratricopeptide (TPR) repeat protein